MKNMANYDILKDIYNIVDRLEQKMDKRLCEVEKRTDILEEKQSKILGAVSIIALFVGGAVTWFWETVKSKVKGV